MTDEKPIRTYTLPAALISEYAGHIHTHLVDGSECVNAPVSSIDYTRVAMEMGFPPAPEGFMRYAVMHEIGHHLVAQTGRADEWFTRTVRLYSDGEYDVVVSRIIDNACHGIEQSMDQPESKAEEHLVNRLMRFTMLGEGDPYGELERVFGDRLPEMARELIRVGMPWLI